MKARTGNLSEMSRALLRRPLAVPLARLVGRGRTALSAPPRRGAGHYSGPKPTKSGGAARAPEASEGAATAVNAAIHAAEENLSMRDHFMRLGLWAIVSLNVGIFFSQGDEGAQILEHCDNFIAGILDPQTGNEALEKALENVSRGLSQNDTLKLKLLATPGFFERLIQLVEASSVKVTTRNHAAKSIEAMSGSADAQREMVVRGHHEVLLALMNKEACTLYARKTLATTICNLESLPENAPTLTRAGAIGALVAEQEADPRLVRQRVKVSVSRLALRAHIGDANVLAALPEAERELIARLAAAEQKAAEASPLHGVRATLIESGVLLYLHTAGGGAAWGLFESLRLQQPRSVMLQNVARTALVTCFVPILMVGGVVTAYNRVNKRTDSISEKFWLYFTVCVGLYPAQRMLTMVEKFAPLWLGGHIVGFASFFVWTIYTESDLLKSDNALLSEQQVGPPQKKKLVVLWEAKPRSADTVKAAVVGPQPLSAPAPQPKLDH